MLIVYKCKSCGGDLIFNIAKQDMECTFCNSHFPVADYMEDRSADEDDVYETTVYTCTQCGAELTSQDNSAVAFCSYCGTEAVLESRISREYRPAKIVPFKKTKEECRKIYMDKVKKEPYPPAEFLDPKFVDKFRGIYIPYWEYDVSFEKEPELKVEESYSEGEYSYHNVYNIYPKIKNTGVVIPCDASSSFDDEIADEIAPFKKEDMEEFNPAYLAGFFADTADVDRETYTEEAVSRAQDHILNTMTEGFRPGAKVEISKGSRERAEILGTVCKGSKGSLYPVWFLTWRKGKRLAYGVINGETGKISAEIPVDIRKFFAVSALISVIAFVVMSIAGTLVLPPTVLMFSVAAAIVVQYFFRKEVIALRDKEKNENNIGALKGEELERAKMSREKKRRGKRHGMLIFLAVIAAIVLLTLILSEDVMNCAIFSSFLLMVAGLVLFAGTVRPLAGIKEKSMFIIGLLPPIAEVTAFYIESNRFIQDWAYYIGSVIVFGALLLTMLTLILRYNLLTTRSIPDFHDRQGGNKDAGR